MILEQWFVTPIWHDFFNDVTEYNYNLAIDYCNYLAIKTKGNIISNVGGWQSDHLYDSQDANTPLNIFFKQLQPHIDQALLGLGVTQSLKVDNYWVNINGCGHSTRLHSHPLSSISGVFYLTKYNSDIVFQRTNDISDYHLRSIKSNLNTPLSYSETRYAPQQGQYILFPSWLKHYVEPSTVSEQRISVAFNVSII
jgi:uncharacterized protein (TIGR02466 family)